MALMTYNAAGNLLQNETRVTICVWTSPSLNNAAGSLLSENSRQGFSSKKINMHQGWTAVNFKTATGIEARLRPKGIRSRCQSLNRYAYVLNNPTNLIDPSGMGPCDGSNPLPAFSKAAGHINDAIGRLEGFSDEEAIMMCFAEGSQFCDTGESGFSFGFNVGGLSGASGDPLSGDYGGGLPPPRLWQLFGPQYQQACDFGPSDSEGTPGNALFGVGLGHSGFPYLTLPGTNYCGPGNTGYDVPPVGGPHSVDAACMAHDLAYDRANITIWNYSHLKRMTPSQIAAKAAADQQLCKTLAGTMTYTPNENANLFYVQEYFGCT